MEKLMMISFQVVFFVLGLAILLYGRQQDSTMLFSVGLFFQVSGLLFSFYHLPA